MDPRPHFLPLILPVIALYDLAGQLEGEFWAEVDVETGLHVVKEVFVYLETDGGGHLGNIAIGIEAVLNDILHGWTNQTQPLDVKLLLLQIIIYKTLDRYCFDFVCYFYCCYYHSEKQINISVSAL